MDEISLTKMNDLMSFIEVVDVDTSVISPIDKPVSLHANDPLQNMFAKPSSPSFSEVDSSILARNNPSDSVFLPANDPNNPPQEDMLFINPMSPSYAEDFFKLNINKIQDTGRESLAILKDLDLSIGKESLGILKLEAITASLNEDNLNIPTICLPGSGEQSLNLSDNPLNTAFLYSASSRKTSDILDNSYNINPSFFNSASLDPSEPSKIFSCNSFKTSDAFSKSQDVLNEAFLSTALCNLDVNDNRSKTEDLVRKRARSTIEEVKDRLDGAEELKGEIRSSRGYQSVSEFPMEKDENPLGKEINHSDIQEKEEDKLFNNSIFIEAKFIASKIANGSVFNEDYLLLVFLCTQNIWNEYLHVNNKVKRKPFQESCMHKNFYTEKCSVSTENLLDSSDPPDFSVLDQFDVGDYNIDVKTDRQIEFKIRKVSLSHIAIEHSQNTDVPNSNSNNESFNYSEKDLDILRRFNELKENYKTDSYCKNINSSLTSNCSSKSKNANELLQNLSEIINNEDRDPKQKREGQQLLSNLANILCSDNAKASSSKLETSIDSGHSSIEHEERQNEQDLPAYSNQILDSRTAASKSNNEVLDVSVKSRNSQNKRSSQSFSFPSSTKHSSVKLLVGLKAGPVKSSTSLDSKKDKSSGELGKLKPKRIVHNTNAMRKGPLKAVIPLGSMAKCKSFSNKTQLMESTPPKVEKSSSTLFKTKRTSTPISEPSIKPMAQSTPDNKFQQEMDTKPISCSSQLRKRNFYCPISPLVGPPSIGNMSSDSEFNKSTRSGSAPNLSVSDSSKRNSRGSSMIPSPKPMYRRHSATELKVTNNNFSKLKRSYSIGKGSKSFAANCSGVSKESPMNALKKSLNVLQVKNSAVTSKIKSLGLLGKTSKKSIGSNKENVH